VPRQFEISNGFQLTPEIAANVVRDFILPMFDNKQNSRAKEININIP
jgi:hypothetical protein